MRLDLDVLSLAEEVLRDQAFGCGEDKVRWAEHLFDIADRLADIIDHLDQDG